MTKQELAEEFVRRVVTQTFKQKIDAKTIKAVAEKVMRAVDVKE